MYDGNQVVRVVSKYKKHDAYNIGVEMSERKGTGNYDKERTHGCKKFLWANISYMIANG